MAEMMLVVKNREPRYPSDRLNLRLKKFVTHDSGARPLAKESRANSKERLMRMPRDSLLILGQIERFSFGLAGLALPRRGSGSWSRTGAGCFSISHALLKDSARTSLMTPIAA